MTDPSSAKPPWWKYRPVDQRIGRLTWRERFNTGEPKSQVLKIPDAYSDAFGNLLIFLYLLASFLIGVAAFLMAWLYAITTYGIFLGVGLGIFPSFVIGCVAAAFVANRSFCLVQVPSRSPATTPSLERSM
jgi:hypothetical protein